MNITERLFALQDAAYADFQSKLTPGILRERFIGVRVPEARKLAKALTREPDAMGFLDELPHHFYDEDMLHGILISEIKDYQQCLARVEQFLPYVDNWAVCDIMSPKSFRKHKPELLEHIRRWSASSHTYTCRFGLEMLMTHYLDEDFRPELLELPAAARSEEYYVRMMVAWFFATALAKQWDAAVPYLQQCRLEPWTHNKAIQKARESYRITPEQKEYLQALRRKD